MDLREILSEIGRATIAVYGDFCLDAYWILDPQGSEISVETGLQAMAIGKHYYSLGGASNVVANLAALKPGKILAIGTVGNDIYGRELIHQLAGLGVETSGMVIQEDDFDTITYCKQYLQGQEQPRFDFGVRNRRSEETDKRLLKSLSDAMSSADVLIVNQQVCGSIPNPGFIAGVNRLAETNSDTLFLLDTRHYGKSFKGVYRKTNEVEAAQLAGMKAVRPGDLVSLSDLKTSVEKLYTDSNKPVFASRGARGFLVRDRDGFHEIPGVEILGKIDTVGAGDTTLSALACGLATGATPREAAEFANVAASVTVQKLFQTGTASREEVAEAGKDTNYIYQPELAEDSRQARFYDASEIEICCDVDRLSEIRIEHAVFDHDGTISALREGWEEVMEPMMIAAILGEQLTCADETLYHRVRARVREYVEKSTGIQTILQMEALVQMVKEFSCVPDGEILDKTGYKAMYNDALLTRVGARQGKLAKGELDVTDFAVKGAVEFLEALSRRGVTLYLASGTDEEDVVAEAEALGYAKLFSGGIYGSVGDVSKYSKKMVIERIMAEHQLAGSQMACFGDGPVEMRECRKKDGLAVGVASDEIRRHGLNKAKRSRLIQAGAHLVIPDFSQSKQLLSLLFANG